MEETHTSKTFIFPTQENINEIEKELKEKIEELENQLNEE